MKQISLRRRFFLHTAVALIVVMLISLFVVDYSYRTELERSADQRLRLHIFNLLSVADRSERTLTLPYLLSNPGFNTLNSGLWAMVLDEQNRMIWQSLSLDGVVGMDRAEQAMGSWYRSRQVVKEQAFMTMSYQIAWETAIGLEHYRFVVAETETVIIEELNRFRWWLAGGFTLITFSLLLGQHLVLRSSFRPISDLEHEIAELERGDQRTLQKHYPQELKGVTDNLNTLIQKEHEQREKYRASMADLAHSLKTPLSIVKGELQATGSDNDVLHKAITRIDQNIEYQLRRAVISGHSLLYQGTSLDEVLADLLDVLNHAHKDSPVEVDMQLAPSLTFYGDENDLMEILGNLLDNAFRYARRMICIQAFQSDTHLVMVIEDDGPGFSDQQAGQIFKRGERLDQQDFGQGIGLSVVFDIVNSYEGQVKAGRSSMGGARFILEFPCKLEDT